MQANEIINIPLGIVTANEVQGAINQLASAIPSPGPGTDPLSLTQGFILNLNNPSFSTNPNENYGSFNNFRFENADTVIPGFTNIEGMHLAMQALHGDATYSANTQHKTTFAPFFAEATFFAGGQRFLLNMQQHSYGMGDCGLLSMLHDFANGPIPGDEGQGYTPVTRVEQATYDRRCTINNVFRASGNTTITPAITSNIAMQTVAVGSTVNINSGEWYVVEHGPPSPESNVEAVQIISVGAGTITAIFRNNHVAGVTLTPALVMDQDNPRPGQRRVLVNLSGASYSAGTITGTFGAGALTGNITAFADNMVGGDASNIGAISMTKDELTTSPGSVGYPYRSWFEISAVDSPTQIEIVSFSVAADKSYHSTRGTFPTNYVIRPAVTILRVLPGASLVCDTTSTVWNNGDTCEIAVCPYADTSGVSLAQIVYAAGATNRSVLGVSNSGPVPCDTLIGAGGRYTSGPMDKPYTASIGLALDLVKTGITITGVDKALVPDALAMNIANDLPISWHTTQIYGGAAVPFFKIDQQASQGVDFLPPNFEVNTDVNLCEAHLKRYWINIEGVTNVAKPYIRADNCEINTFQNALGTPPIEVEFGDHGFIFNGNFSDPSSRKSCIFQHGLGTKGAFLTAPTGVIAVNGANSPFSVAATSFIRITGPTGAFSIQGFTMGAWGASSHAAGDGSILRVLNATAFAMTITNNAAVGDAGILTLTGSDVVLPARTSSATFIYSSDEARWILMSTN